MSNSSEGQFREIIDDLTIENKKLRRKLHELQDLQKEPARLDENGQLFEIRVIDLPDAKRRELEEVLHRFSLNLSRRPTKKSVSPNYGTSSGVSEKFLGAPHPDSGYASNFPSESAGNNGRSTERGTSNSSGDAKSAERRAKVLAGGRQPGGRTTDRRTQTEMAKARTIVGKLEALFTGGNSPIRASCNIPLSAGSAEGENVNTEEADQQSSEDDVGNREAQILSFGPEFVPQLKPSDSCGSDSSDLVELSRTSSQRPTRQLDLDLERQQDSKANMEYIKHLSLPHDSMRGRPIDSRKSHDDWVYLNVLTNMSQTHSDNVTQDFVRRAILQYSDKLELSSDGKRVRWKGVSKGSKLSNSSGSPPNHGTSSTSPTTGDSPHTEETKRSNSITPPSPKRRRLERDTPPLLAVDYPYSRLPAYHPVFTRHPHFTSPKHNHGLSSVSSSQSVASSAPSKSFVPGSHYDSLAQEDSKPHTSHQQSQHPSDHPGIVFYSDANFVSDLQGDAHLTPAAFTSATTDCQVLGEEVELPPHVHIFRPSSSSAAPSPAADSEVGSSADSDTLPTDHLRNPSRSTSAGCLQVYQNLPAPPNVGGNTVPDFEASGLEGVQPADHFLVFMQKEFPSTRTRACRVLKLHPSRLPDPIVSKASVKRDESQDSNESGLTSSSREDTTETSEEQDKDLQRERRRVEDEARRRNSAADMLAKHTGIEERGRPFGMDGEELDEEDLKMMRGLNGIDGDEGDED